MTITIEIPEHIEAALQREFGHNLDRVATEALAIEAYRAGKFSLGQFAEMLGINTYEADGLLKARGVMLEMTVEDVEAELASLKGLLRR